MALARRCENGCETWPDHKRYRKCPVCGEATERLNKMKPMTQEEANAREFEVFYERWDADRPASRLEADAPDAAAGFRGVGGIVAASADPPRAHRLSPPS